MGQVCRLSNCAKKDFYSKGFYSQVSLNDICTNTKENTIPKKYLNHIFQKSCTDMSELPNNSVHLVVTSPPYNVNKDYDIEMNLDEYLAFLRSVFLEVKRVLVDTGRLCINIAGIGRKPYIPLHSYLSLLLIELGFNMRGDIIWYKKSAVRSLAFGSWMSASNPVLRDSHEYVLVFSKGATKRTNPNKKVDSISKLDFLTQTKSVWHIAPSSAKKIGHPAPFPIELAKKLIELYSFEKDIVLDPFLGSGTTAIACIKTNRHYIGYETSKEYVELAQDRIGSFS